MNSLFIGGSYLIGKPMPSFEIKSVNGKIYSNKKFIDKITFINFWFEACVPCIVEMKSLENLYQFFKAEKKIQFLSITYGNRESVSKIQEKHQMS